MKFIIDEIAKKYHYIEHGFFNKNIYHNINKPLITEIKKYLSNTSIYYTKQVHSNDIAVIYNKTSLGFNYENEFDAMITRSHNSALIIKTADCVPIILFDKNQTFIATIHAGWRGVSKKIIEKMLNLIKSEYSKLSDIIVLIGPCIKQDTFQVGEEVKNVFIKDNMVENERFFIPHSMKPNNMEFSNNTYGVGNKYLFDLTGLIQAICYKYKVHKIYDININTYDNQTFFSHRRCTHNNIKRPKEWVNLSYVLFRKS